MQTANFFLQQSNYAQTNQSQKSRKQSPSTPYATNTFKSEIQSLFIRNSNDETDKISVLNTRLNNNSATESIEHEIPLEHKYSFQGSNNTLTKQMEIKVRNQQKESTIPLIKSTEEDIFRNPSLAKIQQKSPTKKQTFQEDLTGYLKLLFNKLTKMIEIIQGKQAKKAQSPSQEQNQEIYFIFGALKQIEKKLQWRLRDFKLKHLIK